MSEQYLSSAADGFKPLLLPLTGEELQPGRQYLLTPVARVILEEVYGLFNIPTVVECLHAKRPATIVRSITQNAETGKVISTSVMEVEGREATFRAFLSKGKHVVFCLSLEKMEELVPFYNTSHKIPIKEEEWFEVTSKYPPGKFRGCTLRWWKQGAVVGKIPGSPRAASTKKVDISILLDI